MTVCLILLKEPKDGTGDVPRESGRQGKRSKIRGIICDFMRIFLFWLKTNSRKERWVFWKCCLIEDSEPTTELRKYGWERSGGEKDSFSQKYWTISKNISQIITQFPPLFKEIIYYESLNFIVSNIKEGSGYCGAA